MTSIFVFVALLTLTVIVLPLVIVMHYISRWRDQRVLSHTEEDDLHSLWELCESLEARLVNLEQAMDIETAAPKEFRRGAESASPTPSSSKEPS